MDYQQRIAVIISETVNVPLEKIRFLVKEPKKGVNADWAMNCFALRPFLKQDGNKIAQELLLKLQEKSSDYSFIREISQA